MKKSDAPAVGKKDAVLKFAKQILEDAVRARKQSNRYSLYKRGIDYFSGEHRIKNNTEKQGNMVWNKFGEIITNRVAQVVEVRPKWMFKPQGGTNDVFVANALNQIIGDVIWDDVEWEDRGEDALMEAAFAGSCHIKCTYRIEDGWPKYEIIPFPMAFPDLKATNVKSRRYFIHAIVMDVAEVKRRFGVDLVPDSDLELQSKPLSIDDFEVSFEQASSTSYTMDNIWRAAQMQTQNREFLDNIGRCLVFEEWLEDKAVEPIPFEESEIELEHKLILSGKVVGVSPEENHAEHYVRHMALFEAMEDGPFKENMMRHLEITNKYADAEGNFEKTKRKYPMGRVITVSQGKLLDDRPNTLPIHWQDVFLKFDWFKMPLSYWGKPATKDMFDPQDILNHRKNAITSNINNQNRGVVLVARTIYRMLFGDANKAKMKGAVEGYVLPSDNPRNDFIRDNGPALPAHVVQDPLITEEFMERNSGQEGLMAGRYPSGSPPMGAINALMNEAKKPISNVIRHYTHVLKKMARNAIAIMGKYMDEDIFFRILVDDPRDEEKYKMIRWGDLKDRAGLLDIRVDIMEQFATTREYRFNQAILLKQHGIYDNQAVLDLIDDPMKFDVMQRMDVIAQQDMLIRAMDSKIKEQDSELKTAYNRLQGSDGKGNVGKEKSK